MDRWDWMTVRAYVPAACALLVAFVSMGAVAGLQENQYSAAFMPLARWVPLLAFAGSVVLSGIATWRLVRWHRGNGPMCDRCQGPLGRERDGRADRGGAYRQCLGCGDNVNHRHYE
jgi:hypothetical protein